MRSTQEEHAKLLKSDICKEIHRKNKIPEGKLQTWKNLGIVSDQIRTLLYTILGQA